MTFKVYGYIVYTIPSWAHLDHGTRSWVRRRLEVGTLYAYPANNDVLDSGAGNDLGRACQCRRTILVIREYQRDLYP